MEECCVVCAEPLQWVAVGHCDHKEVCWKCVVKMRFVQKDKKCCICKQELEMVYCTRALGSYTPSFGGLEERRKAGDPMRFNDLLDAWIDDDGLYQQLLRLTSLHCPTCTHQRGEDEAPTFNSLGPLKRHLREAHNLFFCELCLTHRQVFVGEQELYSKKDLDHHMAQGDKTGSLSETAFRGHPACKFCRKRFYDDTELFRHMERDHEHCHLCRRRQPDRFVYYKDYEELDRHFHKEHFCCDEPQCLERKFVVFGEEHELRAHIAKEHGDQMTRAQRRAHLTILLTLQYRSGDAREDDGSQTIRGVGQGALLGDRRPQGVPVEAAAGRNWEVEFPSLAPGGGSSTAGAGARWASATGLQRAVDPNAFPSLRATVAPSEGRLSRGQKKNLKKKERAIARDAQAAAAADGASEASGSAGWEGGVSGSGEGAPVTGLRQEEAWQEVPAAPTRRQGPIPGPSPSMTSAPAPTPMPVPVAQAGATAGPTLAQRLAGAGTGAIRVVHRANANDARPPRPLDDAEAFPGLPTGAPAVAAGPVKGRWAKGSVVPRGTAAVATGPAHGAGLAASRFAVLSESQHAATGGSVGDGAGTGARPARPETAGRASSAAGDQAGQQGGAAGVGTSGGASVGAPPKSAVQALMDRVRAIAGMEGLRELKKESAAFMEGRQTSDWYYAACVRLGLQALVPELAAQCPSEQHRAALMEEHRRAVTRAPAGDAGKGAGGGHASAVPLGMWACPVCTLENEDSAVHCDACGTLRPGLDTGAGTGGISGSHTAKGKKKGSSRGVAMSLSAGGVTSSGAGQQSGTRSTGAWADASERSSVGFHSLASMAATDELAEPSTDSHRSASQAGRSRAPVAEDFPGLPVRSAVVAEQAALLESASASASVSSAGGGTQDGNRAGGKKGGRKGRGVPIQLTGGHGSAEARDFLRPPERQNAWDPTGERAAGSVGGGGSSDPKGSWSRGGGSRLASALGAVQDAWVKRS